MRSNDARLNSHSCLQCYVLLRVPFFVERLKKEITITQSFLLAREAAFEVDMFPAMNWIAFFRLARRGFILPILLRGPST
jgi:hypothetical protein